MKNIQFKVDKFWPIFIIGISTTGIKIKLLTFPFSLNQGLWADKIWVKYTSQVLNFTNRSSRVFYLFVK